MENTTITMSIETRAAFDEVEEMKKHPENIKSYHSFAELLEEVEQV